MEFTVECVHIGDRPNSRELGVGLAGVQCRDTTSCEKDHDFQENHGRGSMKRDPRKGFLLSSLSAARSPAHGVSTGDHSASYNPVITNSELQLSRQALHPPPECAIHRAT
jgi:hypothetical protein